MSTARPAGRMAARARGGPRALGRLRHREVDTREELEAESDDDGGLGGLALHSDDDDGADGPILQSRDQAGDGGPNTANTMMLHCLVAAAITAVFLVVLNCPGLAVLPKAGCPAGAGYTRCELLQDARSMLSFLFGALVCCALTGDSRSTPDSGKVQLYQCLV